MRDKGVQYHLMLGVLQQLMTDPTRYPGNNLLATVRRDGRLLVAAMRTPPFKLLLFTNGDQPEALRLLAEHLARNDPSLPGVLGIDDVAEQWAAIWCEIAGATATVGQHIRLHVLNEVSEIPAVSGAARWAAQNDYDILRQWLLAFHDEAIPHAPPPNPEGVLSRNLGKDRLLVWDDGAPVSLAALVRPAGDCISVSLVYTPPERRRHGYATALVAEISRRALAQGYHCCTLYTDLANPISNSIYRKIGYRPVSDWKDIVLTPYG